MGWNYQRQAYWSLRVPQGVKLSSATYCQFLKNVLEPWLEEVPLTRLKKVVFMQ